MGRARHRASEHLPRGARVCRSLDRRSHAGPESETRSGEEGVAGVVCSGMGSKSATGDIEGHRAVAQLTEHLGRAWDMGDRGYCWLCYCWLRYC